LATLEPTAATPTATSPAAASAPPVRRREILAWAMFDFANSSYTTVIVTVGFAVYFTKLVAPAGRGDFLWGLGTLLSNLLVMAAAPLVGAAADESGRKKVLLFASYAACVAGTVALALVGPGDVAAALFLFVVSNMAFAFGEMLAGAFLPELSTPANIGWVSGLGWGLGYFGGLFCLVAVYPFLAGGFELANQGDLRLAWVVTGLFFLVAALPTFLVLRERAPRAPRRPLAHYARAGFARLAATAHAVRHFRELARFLVVFTVYSAGLMTVISFTGIYAERSIGFTAKELMLMFIVVQLSAAGGAVLFGWIQDRLGSRASIRIALVLWIVVCVAAAACRTKPLFWGIALLAGLGIGSLQASSRALVGLFSPVQKSGEFFAFWGFANRVAYAAGPFVFGVISSASGSQRVAILATSLFFVAGLVGMGWVDVERGRRAAAQWRPQPAVR
jgi:UMF1 family MFS transporter